MAQPHFRWRKSSYTGQDNCVEMAHTLDRVRDSKQRSGPELLFAHARLAAFLTAVKNGRLDG
jgi:hypothetical protein